MPMKAPREPPAGRPPALGFSVAEAAELARIAEEQGWKAAAHDSMRSRDHRAYRLAVDEYGAQLRFLLPLAPDSRVLQLRCGWGPVALNLATCAALVVAMDDRRERLRFLSARQAQTENVGALRLVCADFSNGLPFVDGTFDAVILLDAIEQVRAPDGGSWKRAQHAALEEARRVLRASGWLLMGVANRLSLPVAPRDAALPRLRTYWGYRTALRNAGFDNVRFYAPLPSHQEPFFVLPLDKSHLLDHFASSAFAAHGYRSKLQARGLASLYRLASVMWRVGRQFRLTGLVRYLFPSYLVLARK